MTRGRAGVLSVALVAGVGAAWLVHACGERLASVAFARPDPARARGTASSRIAVFSPAAFAIIEALGASESVVGVTRYAVPSRGAPRPPDIGGFVDMNLERLAALDPDLVISQGSSEKLSRFCAERGVPLLVLPIESVFDVLAACREIGRRSGREKEGEALASRIARDLDRVRAATAGLRRVPCFLSIDRRPGSLAGLLTAGRDTFLTEIVEAAGGRNVFDDMEARYPVVSKEALVVRSPEVVFEFRPGAPADDAAKNAIERDWSALPGLPAVSSGRVLLLNREDALLPGPRLAEFAREMAALLHPEAASHDG